MRNLEGDVLGRKHVAVKAVVDSNDLTVVPKERERGLSHAQLIQKLHLPLKLVMFGWPGNYDRCSKAHLPHLVCGRAIDDLLVPLSKQFGSFLPPKPNLWCFV